MPKIDLNKLAKEISQSEGKKVNLSIAQIKEVLRIVLLKMKGFTLDQITELLKRFK